MSPFKTKSLIISVIVASTLVVGLILLRDMSNKPADIGAEVQRYDDIQKRIIDNSCPKCGGVFENGFLLDRSRSAVHVTTWVQGSPKVDGSGVNEEPSSPVVTKRCKACGYLESFAK